jgi:hypothetical protein
VTQVVDPLHVTDTDRRRKELSEALHHAYAPARVVEALAAAGLTANDLSKATGANPRTAALWLEDRDAVIKKKRHQQRIRELKEVTYFVVRNGMIPCQEADWLRDPNRSVDFSTPLELIGEGRWREAGRLYADDVGVEVPKVFLGGR